jgi:tRNA nucleotidyltransferase (CCA-adding enzyme)
VTIEELYIVLLSDKPSIILKNREKEVFDLIPELEKCKGFEQNSDWHIYDVYEHILHVIDNTSSNLVLRLAALFHDVGKPFSYIEDENGIGHFYGHWEVSQIIFNKFASNYNIDVNIRDRVSELIYYHDINLSKIDDGKLKEVIDKFGNEGIIQLFELKRADLLAQNKKYNYMLDEYEIQKKQLIKIKGVDPNEI